MKTVILTQQYLGFSEGSELTFINDKEANDLISQNKAVPKSIDNPTKDKMIRRSKNKMVTNGYKR